MYYSSTDFGKIHLEYHNLKTHGLRFHLHNKFHQHHESLECYCLFIHLLIHLIIVKHLPLFYFFKSFLE